MILITGCAGFIGYHYQNTILIKNPKVDNLNNYYDVRYKKEIKNS